MAFYKCKMCGGTLEVQPGESICECEYCGTKQTIPSVQEKDLQNLFNRANTLRMKAEFDKSAEIYEKIIQADETEAEAYWGLVLCKYGVEYVEDPATYKRIPTCHRTSYEAVVADEDYRSAVKYADALQKSIYEAEAKVIDEIQKGILQVAKNEEPYDVFICYKESDDTGKRTEDSVIANDIYYQLTQEGFKVFYAAITLEDKLGTEYEPYIFSALNSAKVMLVIGTKTEYFNAVWVKNEWSRFLRIMQKDRSRALIPCYRDMDAYELPEEFAHLQAQDMSKIGFINDIIRGINKLVAKPEESVPAGRDASQAAAQGGNANISALVKRGNMALDDREWDKATEFFNRVLDENAECAEAYLGEALAQNKVSSLAELAKKIGPEAVAPRTEILQAGAADTDKEYKIISENLVPGYLDDIKWEPFNFGYESVQSFWISSKNAAVSNLKQNRNLSRAEQYGDEDLRRQITELRKSIDEGFDEKIKTAEEQDKAKKDAILQKYAAFLEKYKEYAGQEKMRAEEKRERDYQSLIADLEKAVLIKDYKNIRSKLLANGLANYKESAEYVGKCDEKIAEYEAYEGKRRRLIYIIVIAAACVSVMAVVISITVIPAVQKRQAYNHAQALFDNGEYEEALISFEELGDYKDSDEMIEKAQNIIDYESAEKQNIMDYESAEKLLEDGLYEDAIKAFSALGDYEDAAERVLDAEQKYCEQMLDKGEYGQAAIAFAQIGDLKRSKEIRREYLTNCQSISCGSEHSVGLRPDGTVVAAGDNSSGQCNVSGWSDIISVSAGNDHTVGLKADGTVVATGSNKYGQCDTSDWNDIVAISAGWGYTMGLKADGTVVVAGRISRLHGQFDVSGWSDIISVATGSSNTIGLKSDGTVIAVGDNIFGECDVSNWTDIVAISVGGYTTVGLKADGTVVATGNNSYGQCDVSGWSDIISVTGGSDYTIGLKSDGTVIAAGDDYWGACDVSNWTDIVAVSAQFLHTIGLRSNGKVVATGHDEYGQCDLNEWTNILVP